MRAHARNELLEKDGSSQIGADGSILRRRVHHGPNCYIDGIWCIRETREETTRRGMADMHESQGGLAASRVPNALGWSGSGFTVSVFVATASLTALPLHFKTAAVRPSSIRAYFLEDEQRVLGELRTYEYDLHFAELPRELPSYLEECLRRACTGGAKLAWLAFEGSFSFDHLLTEDVADQIYGVCITDCEPRVVLDDATLDRAAWRSELAELRQLFV